MPARGDGWRGIGGRPATGEYLFLCLRPEQVAAQEQEAVKDDAYKEEEQWEAGWRLAPSGSGRVFARVRVIRARISIRVCIPVIAYYVSRSLVALHLEVTIRGVIPST